MQELCAWPFCPALEAHGVQDVQAGLLDSDLRHGGLELRGTHPRRLDDHQRPFPGSPVAALEGFVVVRPPEPLSGMTA